MFVRMDASIDRYESPWPDLNGRNQPWIRTTHLHIRRRYVKEHKAMAPYALCLRAVVPHEHHVGKVFHVSHPYLYQDKMLTIASLAFYYRIFAIPQFRRVLWIIAAFVTCYVISVDLVCLFQW